MISYIILKEYYEKNNKINIFNEFIETEIEYIINQTDYDREMALNKLKEFNMDKEQIIVEYLGINKNTTITTNPKLTTNQKLFSQFRTFLDEASTKYYTNKDVDNYINNNIINSNSIITDVSSVDVSRADVSNN